VLSRSWTTDHRRPHDAITLSNARRQASPRCRTDLADHRAANIVGTATLIATLRTPERLGAGLDFGAFLANLARSPS